MEWISSLGLIASLIIIIYLAMRGFSILVIGPACTMIVVLTNNMDITKALLTDKAAYMMAVGGFVSKFFLLFLLGSIFAKYMEDSGAVRSIANSIMKKTGTGNPYRILLAIFLVSSVLTYGGINLFVAMFAIIPVARPLFRMMNIAWHLITAPVCLGLVTFTMTMLPGAPSIQNAIPTAVFGTTLTAAPLLGVVASIVTIIAGLWYMRVALVKSQEANEGYEVTAEDDKMVDNQNLPSIGLSLAPLVLLITLIFGGSFLKVANSLLGALCITIIFTAAAFNTYIARHTATLNDGARSSVTPAIFTAAAVGFGIVIASAPGFNAISGWISTIPGSPLIKLSITASLMSAVTGSSSGSLGIIMEAFGRDYLATGINPEILHRVAAIASGPFSAMPHSGAVLTLLAITGLTHKQAYRHIFMTICCCSYLALFVVLALASIM